MSHVICEEDPPAGAPVAGSSDPSMWQRGDQFTDKTGNTWVVVNPIGDSAINDMALTAELPDPTGVPGAMRTMASSDWEFVIQPADGSSAPIVANALSSDPATTGEVREDWIDVSTYQSAGAVKTDAAAAKVSGKEDDAAAKAQDDRGVLARASQAVLTGEPLSKDPDSALAGISVPGAAAGVRSGDWLSKGIMQGASNLAGKAFAKGKDRGEAAVAYPAA